MESIDARRNRLYGPDRNLRVEEIRRNLSKSCVLKEGEYNFTPKGLSKSVFGTSYETDFPWKRTNHDENARGQSLDPSFFPETKEQLSHHFEIGNDSGKNVPMETYRDSTTKADFLTKPPSKPEMILDSKIINWPDMAPRYMTSRKIGNSEYSNAYIPEFFRTNSLPPNHPRLNTSIMKLPLSAKHVHPQRGTSIAFGSDEPQVFSEFQRAYGVGDEPTSKMEGLNDGKNSVITNMKLMEKESHVFRTGDYDNIVGKMKSTVNDDYGPRTLPPGEAAIRKAKLSEIKEDSEKNETEEDSNQLAEYARQVIVPNVLKDAGDGKIYQTSAHFHFGTDPDTSHSIYNKDFISRSMTTRGPPSKMITADAGSLFHNDPSYLREPTTSNKTDFSYTPAMPWKNSKGQTAMEMNLEKRDTDNVIMSFDPNRHTFDRQISLAHADYKGPPKGYKPMEAMKKPRVVFDYLTPNDALPYPGLVDRTSEAKTNFSGSLMAGQHAVGRRRQQENVCRQRLNEGKETHFTIGYQPFDFASESQLQYQGDQKNDGHIPPAGKTEKKQEGKPFLHFFVSQNTQDLKANDPYTVNTNESLRARDNHCRLPVEHAMRNSVMKSDFTPLEARTVSNIELRTIMDCDRKFEKPISSSHLFHTDNSGRNNFATTAMADFIKPESMTGQKFLAAR